jgi:Galactose-3-O-sulfotransferase
MPAPLAFFSHIPKAAGSTLLEILRAQYRRGELLELYDVSGAARDAKLAALAPEVRMIAGHHNFSLRSRVPRPCHCLTLLRDPIELAISLFYYIRSSPTHVQHAQVVSGELTLRQLAHLERNRQATWIAGERKATTLPDDEVLARATAQLLAEDVTFGLAEAFDESVVLFSRALGWTVRPYLSRNLTRDRPRRGQLSADDLAAIEESAAIDLALYRFAQERFAERVRAQPPVFARDLARLRAPTLRGSVIRGWRSLRARFAL